MIPISESIISSHSFKFALIQSCDCHFIAEGFKQLSPASIYNRFHSVKSKLTNDELSFFSDIDLKNHFAIGVIEKVKEKYQGVGVVRCIRDTKDPTEAEVAITVIDSYHNLGLGTRLYTEIIKTAKEHGIKTLTQSVLSHNSSMIRLLDKFHARNIQKFHNTYIYTIQTS